MNRPSEPGLEFQDVRVHFPVIAVRDGRRKAATVKAIDGISLQIGPTEVFGLAGESGCGKSTLARVLMGLITPTAGTILFAGQEIGPRTPRQVRAKIQMVFQDPYSSLNPRRSIGNIVSDPLVVHGRLKPAERREKALRLLEQVGLAAQHYYRFPHEISGGQRQRVAIARALVLDPQFLVLDEPTSALDVSVQARILNLLQDVRRARSLGCLFITHDLNLMRFITQRLAVMYLGRIMECGTTEEVFQEPRHPYTRALIAATPTVSRLRPQDNVLQGELPSPVEPVVGCPFHKRCPEKIGQVCETLTPESVWRDGRLVACHIVNPPA